MTLSSTWMGSLRARVEFYSRRIPQSRNDEDFDWEWFGSARSGRFFGIRRAASRLMFRLGLRKERPIDVSWLTENADRLWATRRRLADDQSRALFDDHLVLKVVGHNKYYFPRSDYEDVLTIVAEEPFRHESLPQDYLGLPLRVFRVRPSGGREAFSVLTTRLQLDLLNRFRQYLPRRNGHEFGPRRGEVVIDCGACIGEVSMIFAEMVGPGGAVHLFDPVPLHGQFCKYQGELNPNLAHVLRVNALAVSDKDFESPKKVAETGRIDPGAVPELGFSTITLDGYCESLGVERVDYIKMDIEGGELAALNGAARTIARLRPRLAISAYHRPDDLWVLANKILELNPGYQLSFGHHSPIHWESVLYARQP